MNRNLRLFLLPPILAVSGLCQSPVYTLFFDTSNMRVAIHLDRKVYLPDEAQVLTIEVSNPGSQSVRTLTPFLPATGCVVFRTGEDGHPVGPSPNHPAAPYDLSPTECLYIPVRASDMTSFAPGETRKLVRNSYDRRSDRDQLKTEDILGTPEEPGEYGITDWYGAQQQTAAYSVAPAQLEAQAVAAMPGKRSYLHVIALRSGEASYLCVPVYPSSQSAPIARAEVPAGKPSFDWRHVATVAAIPFHRVATSAHPVANLSAVWGADENLTIQWTDSAGTPGRLTIPYPFQRH